MRNTLIKHETLTIGNLKEENLGSVHRDSHLKFLIEELVESGHINMLCGVTPLPIPLQARVQGWPRNKAGAPFTGKSRLLSRCLFPWRIGACALGQQLAA